jgi:AcrR family transcriptional regulator
VRPDREEERQIGMSNKKTESLNRAIRTAAELFSERPFDEVQIAEIAARAHCSSATIYEAFETKKGLFRAALLHNSGDKWPVLTRTGTPTTLFPLMNFLNERIAGLSKPSMHNFWRSVSSDTTHVEQVMKHSLLDTDRLGVMVEEVQVCMDEGLLRAGDPSAVAYLLLAGTGFEPVVYGLLYGRAAAATPSAILEAVLSPLVTDLGHEELIAFVGRPNSDAAGHTPPHRSLLGFLQGSGPSRVASPPPRARAVGAR